MLQLTPPCNAHFGEYNENVCVLPKDHTSYAHSERIATQIRFGQRFIQAVPRADMKAESLLVCEPLMAQDWWIVRSSNGSYRYIRSQILLDTNSYLLVSEPETKEIDSYREACWEDLGRQDISAGPVQVREAFDHGYNSARARYNDAALTCRAIAEGAGLLGDPDTYPDYIRTMCRTAIEEFTPLPIPTK